MSCDILLFQILYLTGKSDHPEAHTVRFSPRVCTWNTKNESTIGQSPRC